MSFFVTMIMSLLLPASWSSVHILCRAMWSARNVRRLVSLRRDTMLYSIVPMALSTPVAPLTTWAYCNWKKVDSRGEIIEKVVKHMFSCQCIRVNSHYTLVIVYIRWKKRKSNFRQMGKYVAVIVAQKVSTQRSWIYRNNGQNESETMLCDIDFVLKSTSD